MRLQDNLIPAAGSDILALYVRLQGDVSLPDGTVRLSPGAVLETNTYLNAFDAGTWARYTGMPDWHLTVQVRGRCRAELVRLCGGASQVCDLREGDGEMTLLPPEELMCSGVYSLRLTALEEAVLLSAEYRTESQPRNPETKIGLIICTYHRLEAVQQNMELLQQTRFFDPADPLFGRLAVHVVDNGSELPLREEANFRVFHNPNTGGSGGFTRGLKEFRAIQEETQLTHVVFMDDDVEFLPESLYRLWALLACAAPEHGADMVAGRMFRTDHRNVQYTAAEIWNGGDLSHVGYECDMSDPAVLETMNDNAGAEYGGWWFCCFNMAFAMVQDPLPVFLHCDDVEYGLRHGGTPILLNGIQVWHETFEKRQTPMIRYYDTRNPLIVNAIHCPEALGEQALGRWRSLLGVRQRQADYHTEYMEIRGMLDFLRGSRWLKRLDPERNHKRLSRRRRFPRFVNMVLRRLATLLYRRRWNQAAKQYREMGKTS